MGNRLLLKSLEGNELLEPDTLFFAIDETGHEDFNDPKYPLFGFGGCGCMIRDYSRLLETPWEFMCANSFSGEKRPLHAADIKPSETQIDSLNQFFTRFQFFRVAALASKNTLNIDDYETIDVMANLLLKRICDVAKWANFNRLFIIFEESQRIEMKIMNSLANKKFIRDNIEIPIELGLMPKSTCNASLEVADFIIHTAGRQVRHRITKGRKFLPDFTAVFKTVDSRLHSFIDATKCG